MRRPLRRPATRVHQLPQQRSTKLKRVAAVAVAEKMQRKTIRQCFRSIVKPSTMNAFNVNALPLNHRRRLHRPQQLLHRPQPVHHHIIIDSHSIWTRTHRPATTMPTIRQLIGNCVVATMPSPVIRQRPIIARACTNNIDGPSTMSAVSIRRIRLGTLNDEVRRPLWSLHQRFENIPLIWMRFRRCHRQAVVTSNRRQRYAEYIQMISNNRIRFQSSSK